MKMLVQFLTHSMLYISFTIILINHNDIISIVIKPYGNTELIKYKEIFNYNTEQNYTLCSYEDKIMCYEKKKEKCKSESMEGIVEVGPI